jgi:hypothetical protein
VPEIRCGSNVDRLAAVAFEDYELGAKPDTRWASFSMARSIAINPQQKLVIVVLSARPKPNSALSPIDDLPFFAAVARALP